MSRHAAIDYTVVVPTTGRPSLATLLRALDRARGPAPEQVVVVDDRVSGPALTLPATDLRVTVVRSGGRGPATARNVGWQLATTDWVAFLDDDVVPGGDWRAALVADLRGLAPEVGASQAVIDVPLPRHRRPTDDERGTAALARARWITADMAYRREALSAVDGFDERFPRAYREDADLALRVSRAGYRIDQGERVTTHPVKHGGPLASVRAQRGNADNALLRRTHGPRWRELIGEGPGRLGPHAVATALAATAVAAAATGNGRIAAAATAGWTAATLEFAAARIRRGPRSADEVAKMLLSSALIPPAACWHRLRGEWSVRRAAARARREGPAAVLFDRDDTLIVDVPYLNDPAGVTPVPGAEKELRRLRERGIKIGVVSNQSGVAHGLISLDQLREVNARVERLLGPFETWQVCPHGPEDGCACRKPAAGLVRRAARELAVEVDRCVVIGDTDADVRAAEAAGARGILVPTARTLPAEVLRARKHGCLARDLRSALTLAGVR